MDFLGATEVITKMAEVLVMIRLVHVLRVGGINLVTLLGRFPLPQNESLP